MLQFTFELPLELSLQLQLSLSTDIWLRFKLRGSFFFCLRNVVNVMNMVHVLGSGSCLYVARCLGAIVRICCTWIDGHLDMTPSIPVPARPCVRLNHDVSGCSCQVWK